MRKKDGGMFVHTYLPAQTRAEERGIKWFAAAAMQGRPPLDCAVEVRLAAYFPIPRTWSGKKQREAVERRILPTVKPDLSNVTKLAEDAMNGLVYRDDAQITRLVLEKYYSLSPRVEITVAPCEPTAQASL